MKKYEAQIPPLTDTMKNTTPDHNPVEKELQCFAITQEIVIPCENRMETEGKGEWLEKRV